MTAATTATARYSLPAIVLHWLIFALIAAGAALAFYMTDLPLSPLRHLKRVLFRRGGAPPEERFQRKIQEQYRAAWGEEITRKQGRPVGWLELTCLLEKLSYPLALAYFALARLSLNILHNQDWVWGVALMVSTATGRPAASTKSIILTPFPALVLPIPSPPPLASQKVPSMNVSNN